MDDRTTTHLGWPFQHSNKLAFNIIQPANIFPCVLSRCVKGATSQASWGETVQCSSEIFQHYGLRWIF